MLRDCRKTQDYFERYLREQETRIVRFSKKLEELVSDQKPLPKIQQCHRFLSSLMHDKFYAQYSLGCEKSLLMQTFQAYLLHVQTQGSLTYQEVLDTLSLAVLFQVDPKSTLPAAYIPQDALLQSLYSYQNGRTEDAPEDSKLLFPDTTSVFMETLQEKRSAEDLREYIQSQWYEDNKESAWFDSDKRTDDTYCGYWCFEGAAVALIRKFERNTFSNCRFFPVDML